MSRERVVREFLRLAVATADADAGRVVRLRLDDDVARVYRTHFANRPVAARSPEFVRSLAGSAYTLPRPRTFRSSATTRPPSFPR